MKLSLLFPSWYNQFGGYKYAAKKVSTFPPLNLCLLAAMAEKAGWQIQLIDAHIEELDHQSIVKRVVDFQPDLIGLTATTPFFNDATKLGQMLKHHIDVPIMMGGTHVSICREKSFKECFDYLFIGECEMTFPKFIASFADGDRFPDLPGIMMRHKGEIVYHGDAPFLDDLDKAPLPARHFLPYEKYFLGTLRGKKLYTSVQMSRGCPFSCTFCASDLHGRRVRHRSVDNVMEELELVVKKMGISHIYFVDDTLTLNRKFIMDLCDEIEKRNLYFTFESSTRADLWDEEMAKRLKECGLVRISFGLETADLRVREIIKKNIPLESHVEANSISNKLGIETINSVMMGLPGDTRESIERTIDFLCKSRDLLHVTYNIAVPYPGTEMLKQAESGMHGLKLVERDFSRYHRYGSAVMEVNGISPEELIDLQRKALFRIYACWWRWIPMIKRFGFMVVMLTALNALSDFLKSRVVKIWSKKVG